MENKRKRLKKKKVKVLDRHRLLLKTLSDNIRSNMSMEQAMLAVGYSPSYAKSSTHLTNTTSWESQRDQVLTPAKLLKVHIEGLSATRQDRINISDSESIPTESPDYAVRHKYLDSAYKLRGNYDNTSTIRHELVKLTPEEEKEVLDNL